MKHFYISLVIFFGIIAGSVASNFYATQTIDNLVSFIRPFDGKEEIGNEELERIDGLKNEFYSKKNMLQLFINKEHIEEVEIDIIQLESAVQDKDTEQSKEKSIDALFTLKFIKDNLVAFD